MIKYVKFVVRTFLSITFLPILALYAALPLIITVVTGALMLYVFNMMFNQEIIISSVHIINVAVEVVYFLFMVGLIGIMTTFSLALICVKEAYQSWYSPVARFYVRLIPLNSDVRKR